MKTLKNSGDFLVRFDEATGFLHVQRIKEKTIVLFPGDDGVGPKLELRIAPVGCRGMEVNFGRGHIGFVPNGIAINS
jgi:hypothetical protein